MKQIFLLQIILTLIISANSFAQTNQDKQELIIQLLDKEKNTPLSFASIVVLKNNDGTVTNENGYFSLDISKLKSTDKIGFHYLGYKSIEMTIKDLQKVSVVHLTENIFNINKVFVFSEVPDAKAIVKKIIENKDKNYISKNRKSTVFIRERYTTDVNKMNLIFKKSSFKDINSEVFKQIENKIPKHQTSYTDFFGELYFSDKVDTLKVNTIKIVSLKEKQLGLDKFKSNFEKAFKNTKENEFWKMKTGIFGVKIQNNSKDTVETKKSKIVMVADDFDEDKKMRTSLFRSKTQNMLKFSNLNDKDDWEFLHKTNKYNYTIAGGTSIKDEDVFIIDFKPKKRGDYEGRLYVSMKTFALIRADYKYATGKTGLDFNFLGIGISQNKFKWQIIFAIFAIFTIFTIFVISEKNHK